jgi:hypothetical protein
MPSTFTVQAVKRGDDYEFKGDDGQVYMTAYELQVSGDQTNGFDPVTDTLWVHRRRGAENTPKQGDELHVDVSKDKRGWKGKSAARRDRSPLAGGSSAGYRNPPTPEEEARMRHTSALSAAPDYYRLLREENAIPKPENKDQMVATLEGIVTWLEGTYPA